MNIKTNKTIIFCLQRNALYNVIVKVGKRYTFRKGNSFKNSKRFYSSFQRKITNTDVESTVGEKRYFKRGVLMCKGSRFGKVTVEATITQPSSPLCWETDLLFKDLGKDFELILAMLPHHWENHGHPCSLDPVCKFGQLSLCHHLATRNRDMTQTFPLQLYLSISGDLSLLLS